MRLFSYLSLSSDLRSPLHWRLEVIFLRLSSYLRSSSCSRSSDNLKRNLVSLKVPKIHLELHMGTILGRVGLGQSQSDYKDISVQFQLQSPAGMVLSLAISPQLIWRQFQK